MDGRGEAGGTDDAPRFAAAVNDVDQMAAARQRGTARCGDDAHGGPPARRDGMRARDRRSTRKNFMIDARPV